MANTYLITGGTSDIGLSLVQRLLCKCKDDDTILLQGNKSAKEVQGHLPANDHRVKVFQVDLSNADACDAFIDDVLQRYTVSHFVHLPASKFKNVRFRDFDFEGFERDAQIQLRSACEICKAILPAMQRARKGRILFMLTSSVLGMPPKYISAYVVIKSALQGLAKSLAAEYAEKGITVNCVAPSMIETKFLSDIPDLIVQISAKNNPMGRNATPEDITPAMEFLLSDEAAYITGVTLPITGGSAV